MIEPQFRKQRQTTNLPRCRDGITAVELIISSVLLITVMSFVTTICFQINLVWKDIDHHRVAMGELSNQLEELTQFSRVSAEEAINGIQPSSVCARTLRNPVLQGELIDDAFGTRIVLQINWERRNPGKPVELVGWITSDQSNQPNRELGENDRIQSGLTSESFPTAQLNQNVVELVTSTEATQ